jgi:hypothetical protein
MAMIRLLAVPEQDIAIYFQSDNTYKISHLLKIFQANTEGLKESGLTEANFNFVENDAEIVLRNRKVSVAVAKFLESLFKFDAKIHVYGREGEVLLFKEYKSSGDHVTHWVGIDESRD